MAENEKSTTVKSVFKSGESTTTEQEFTEMWTSLINTLERSKLNISTCKIFVPKAHLKGRKSTLRQHRTCKSIVQTVFSSQ